MEHYASEAAKPIKRLNATLPDPLARFVAEVTGEGGLYETPSELVRDLIRRYMERVQQADTQAINAMLVQALEENDYTQLKADDFVALRREIEG
jgi:Arc/MetJ-type ribon-helix-helix transcriptional regulator